MSTGLNVTKDLQRKFDYMLRPIRFVVKIYKCSDGLVDR
jgi:hypothetical protein